MASEPPQLSITVEFSGGLEMIFANQREHALSLPAADDAGKPATIAFLIDYLCRHVMKDTRKHLFVENDHL